MRVLVTGGAGYLGSILVPRLLRDGHQVVVVDNFMYGQTSLLDCCGDPNFEIIRGDVRDERIIGGLLSRVDVVLPLACLTGAPACARDPDGATAINHDAIVTMARKLGRSQRLVFPCTNSGYGTGRGDVPCDETTPMRPVSLYGRLKADLERALLDDGRCVSLRFATLFGVSPRMRLDLLVNDFTYRAVVDGFVVLFEADYKRNYLHVSDAARAFMHAVEHFDAMKGRAYNVGLADANLSKRELCEIIRKHVPRFEFPLAEIGTDPDQRNYVTSNERIAAAGFRARIGLDEGIQELVKGYQIVRRMHWANVP